MSTWELASTVGGLAVAVGGVLMHYPGAVFYDVIATRIRHLPVATPGTAPQLPPARLHNVTQ